MRILIDPVYAKQLDDLLDKMTLIQEVDNHINYLNIILFGLPLLEFTVY